MVFVVLEDVEVVDLDWKFFLPIRSDMKWLMRVYSTIKFVGMVSGSRISSMYWNPITVSGKFSFGSWRI